MAMFGKALGNGYGITAIIGKENIMQATQDTFISSTFWTERIGPTAALKTLDVMQKKRSWEKISEKGDLIKQIWKELAKKNNIPIVISGIRPIPSFTIRSRIF